MCRIDGIYFRMRLSVFLMETFANDFSRVNDHATDHRVGADIANSKPRQLNGALHKFFVIIHHAKFADVSQTAEQVFQNTFSRLSKVFDEREARSIASILLEDKFGISKMDVMMKENVEIDQTNLDQSIERLLKNEPVQHVTGIAHFMGEKFLVNENVLVPRPETEELVDWVIRENADAKFVIWDIGTGSGCIAMSISKAFKAAQVFGIDISEEALEVARKNDRRIGSSVEFVCQDVLIGIPDILRPDVIISNPPYIPEEEKALMNRNVVDYDPELALFVPNEDPLLFYRRIAEVGLEVLSENGLIYFEIHESQGAAVVELLSQLGYETELRKDLQGKDRMVRARRCV